jgi:hypothetical protein
MKSAILIDSGYAAAEAMDHFCVLVETVNRLRSYLTNPRLLIQHSLKEDRLGLMVESDSHPPIGAHGGSLREAVMALEKEANTLKNRIDNENSRTKDEPAAGKESGFRNRRKSPARKRSDGVRKG